MPDTDSIHNIFISIKGSLARAIFGIVPPKEIEDIVQETYVRVCQIERKDKIKTPRSFLFKTARNLALDHVKRAESRLVIGVDDTDDCGIADAEQLADETFDHVASNEEFSLFCEAVRQLPVQCRRAFVLKKVYGYTQREIAGKMSLSESTVEKHIAQGIKRCTYFMMQYDEQHHSGERLKKSERTQRVSPQRKEGRL